MRGCVIAWLAVLTLWPAQSSANGRFPQTVDVWVQPGVDDRQVLAATFGLLLSDDGGESFRWVCEDALGYSGTFDPDYAVTSSGALLVGAFDGVRISSDGGCTWPVHPTLAGVEASDIEVGADGRIWVAALSAGEGLWVSEDGGVTFDQTPLAPAGVGLLSVRVAPSDPDRIYVSGQAPGMTDADAGPVGPADRARLWVSDDGGDSFSPLPVTDFAFGTEPVLEVVGVWPGDPDVLFVNLLEKTVLGDAVYRSDDGGASFAEVLETPLRLQGFHVADDGSKVIAGGAFGVRISADGGQSFSVTAETPQLACVTELSDGELVGCGANWEPDMMALGRSADGQSWTATFRFPQIAGSLECPDGTVQADSCVDTYFDVICGFTAAEGCPARPDAGPGGGADASVMLPDAGGGGGGGGCGGCSAGLLILFGWPLSRARRARRSRRAT